MDGAIGVVGADGTTGSCVMDGGGQDGGSSDSGDGGGVRLVRLVAPVMRRLIFAAAAVRVALGVGVDAAIVGGVPSTSSCDMNGGGPDVEGPDGTDGNGPFFAAFQNIVPGKIGKLNACGQMHF